VIGLVQIGAHAMADRFTYIPSVGVCVGIAWGVPDLLAAWTGREGVPPRWRWRLAAAAAGVLIALAARTVVLAGHWRDTVSLYTHALRVTGGNHVAHNNLGQGLQDAGRYEEAAEQYRAAITYYPERPETYVNLGIAWTNAGRVDEALDAFEEALARQGTRRDALTANIQYSAALALLRAGRKDEALARLRDAVDAFPAYAPARYALGKELSDRGDQAGAIAHYREALRFEPGMVPALNNLAVALFLDGRYAEAWEAVVACRARGFEPPAGFLAALAAKMPEPRGP
jgi:tetratricopeptide (TPR) repeat protein